MKRIIFHQQDSRSRDRQRFIKRQDEKQARFTKPRTFKAYYEDFKSKELVKSSFDEYARMNDDWWKELEEDMKTQWVITDEWSEYHKMVASQIGFGLEHKQGMWEIVTRDPKRFPTDDAAREFVLFHEGDPENSVYDLAINAVFLGNMGKV